MSLDNLISALRQEASRIDEAIIAVERLIDAHREREEAAADVEADCSGARFTTPTIHRLQRHRHRPSQELNNA